MAVYFATKAFVLSLSEALHEEVRHCGVNVVALCPGPTRTEFGEVAGFKAKASIDRFFMESAPVVQAGLEALEKNKAIAIPGAINKLSGQGHRLLPRSVVRKIAGSIKF
jgi:short-subunit dehydrogenase